LSALALGVEILASVSNANAACNLIPGTEKTFSSTVGAANRPYSAPGERIELRLRSCDPSPGFMPLGGDHVVTLAFPSAAGTRMVALAENCGGVDLAACNGAPGVISSTCVTMAPGTLVSRNDVDTGDRRFAFVFPDTDALFAPDGDDVTLAGPVSIGVTAVGAPPACGLATAGCGAQAGLIACIDELYANDGACGKTVPHAQFTHFTALPTRTTSRPTASTRARRAPRRRRGSAPRSTPTATCSSRSDGPACSSATAPSRSAAHPHAHRVAAAVLDPGQAFLSSFTPEGGLLPPILEPQLDPTVSSPDVVTFFGSVDAPYTTIRIARRHGTCNGGDENGERCSRNADCGGGLCQTSCVDAPATACTVDANCPSGSCGSLFDFSGLVASGGAINLPRAFPQFCQLPPHDTCAGPGDCLGSGTPA
jgi:hypothetical protein